MPVICYWFCNNMIFAQRNGCASATGIEAGMTYMTRNKFGRVYNSSGKQLYAVLDLYFNQETFKRNTVVCVTECMSSVQNIDCFYTVVQKERIFFFQIIVTF